MIPPNQARASLDSLALNRNGVRLITSFRKLAASVHLAGYRLINERSSPPKLRPHAYPDVLPLVHMSVA